MENNIRIEPSPAWIYRPPQIPEPSEDYHYIYFDRQYRETDQSSDYFCSQRRYIRHEDDLKETQNISLNYNPEYQSVVFHDVHIIRNGTNISLESSVTSAEVFRRERQLEAQILNGTMTLNILIPGLRIGDQLHYSYTMSGRNPVLKQFQFIELPLEYAVPVRCEIVRVLWEMTTPMEYAVLKTPRVAVEKFIRRDGQNNIVEVLWELENIEAVAVPDQTPSTHHLFQTVRFVNRCTWENVIGWGIALYADVYRDSKEIVEIAKTLQASTSEVSIRNALVFVQENIRYFSISVNEGSHKPRNSTEVFSSKFGDCKDKTGLLISLIHAFHYADVKAFPLLVNTTSFFDVTKITPSPLIFDHVIVCVQLNGKDYFFDPTYDSQKFDFEKIPQPRYFLAGLPLAEGFHDLLLRKIGSEYEPVEITVDYDLTSGPNEDIFLTVRERNQHFYAQNVRGQLRRTGKKDFAENVLNYYKGIFPKVEQVDFVVTDDLKSNTLSTVEHYKISEFWKKNGQFYKVQLPTSELIGKISYPSPGERHNVPIALSYPLKYQYTLRVRSDRVWGYKAEDKHVLNDFWKFEVRNKEIKKDKTIVVEMTFEHLQSQMPAEFLNDYRKDLNDFIQGNGINITATKQTWFSRPRPWWFYPALVGAMTLARLLAR